MIHFSTYCSFLSQLELSYLNYLCPGVTQLGKVIVGKDYSGLSFHVLSAGVKRHLKSHWEHSYERTLHGMLCIQGLLKRRMFHELC